MTTYFNNCRTGEKPKYYSSTVGGYNYVFSNSKDLEGWIDVMEKAEMKTKSGRFEEIKTEFRIIEQIIPAGNLNNNQTK